MNCDSASASRHGEELRSLKQHPSIPTPKLSITNDFNFLCRIRSEHDRFGLCSVYKDEL